MSQMSRHSHSQSHKSVRLNLGSGPVCPPNWKNVDGSNRAWLAATFPLIDRLLSKIRILPPTEFYGVGYVDLTNRFPWNDESVDVIYMGELLEHFNAQQGKSVIRECYRVLKKDGILRIRVPDNAKFWKSYLNEYDSVYKQPRASWNENHTRWVEMFFDDICIHKPRLFRSMGHFHKWMYDDVSLILLLESCGFRDVDRMQYHKSRITDVDAVEVRDDLIVEAVK